MEMELMRRLVHSVLCKFVPVTEVALARSMDHEQLGVVLCYGHGAASGPLG